MYTENTAYQLAIFYCCTFGKGKMHVHLVHVVVAFICVKGDN